MKISVGSDHAGYLIKEEIKNHLINKGYEVIDVGTNSLESCDYPLFGHKCAQLVANKEVDFGILVCSSGEGIMIAANKVDGVRAGIGYNDDVTRLLRQHNDANIISFGASFMSKEDILRRVDIFLNTDFEGGRHARRVDEIKSLEK